MALTVEAYPKVQKEPSDMGREEPPSAVATVMVPGYTAVARDTTTVASSGRSRHCEEIASH